ncbi:MAG: hypothetical protein ACUVRZ_01555 [Desulfobacca sp.]|uniref:hypothetical protein n=1 Tax=Desulfobacca sp. TaxID=2067990 RepID=UPI004049EB7C
MKFPAPNKGIPYLTLLVLLVFSLQGCTTIKKWTGLQTADDEEVAREAKEAAVAPEAVGDTVVIGGKTYVRGRNPYYLTYPAEPEFVYYEKGKEFTGLGDVLAKWRDQRSGKEKGITGVPPEKVQEMVRAEVERILREQGRGGDFFVSKVKASSPYSGRAVAVVPALRETPKGYDGLNLTLANNLRADLARQRDLVVIPEAATKEAEGKLIGGKIGSARNIQALGQALGVQGVIITQVIPPGYKDSSGYVALSLYETFNGSEIKTILEPFAAGDSKTDVAQKVVSRSSLLLGNEIRGLEWFGRIEFLEKEKIFVNVGNNTGLKPGKVLQVVQPGKEVRNPQTNALLGYTSDVPKGELRVTEVLGKNAVAAVAVSGGPFQPNDLVKPR